MADTYHDGMPLQADYANLFFDPDAGDQYHLGMIQPPSPLRQLRLKRGLTQEGLAAAIGTQQSQVSRWESEPDTKNPDRSRIPTTWWALKLGEFFKVRSTVFIPHIDKKGSLDALLEDAPAHIKAEATEFIMRRLVEQVKADAAAKAAATPDSAPKRARRPRKT